MCLPADCFSNNEFQQCNATYNSTWWIYNYGHCITNITEAEMLGVNSTVPKEDRVSRKSSVFVGMSYLAFDLPVTRLQCPQLLSVCYRVLHRQLRTIGQYSAFFAVSFSSHTAPRRRRGCMII